MWNGVGVVRGRAGGRGFRKTAVLEGKDLGAHKKGFVGTINSRLFTQLVE